MHLRDQRLLFAFFSSVYDAVVAEARIRVRRLLKMRGSNR